MNRIGTTLLSVSNLVWVITLLVVTLSAARLDLINRSDAPARTWRQGTWILEHRAVPAIDPLAYTTTDAAAGGLLTSGGWLGELLFAIAGQAGGWAGIVVLAGLLVATIFRNLHRLVLAERSDLLLATLLTGLGIASLWPSLEATPRLFSLLLTIIFLARLRMFERGALSTKRLLLWLVPLTALWANLDGGWLIGPGLIAWFAIAHLDQPARAGRLALVGALALLASLLNPFGWRWPLELLTFGPDPLWGRYATGWASPNFHLAETRGFLWVLGVVVLLLTVARPRLRPVEIGLLALGAWWALRTARQVPTFTILALPILAAHWSTWFRRRRDEEGRTTWHAVADRLADWQHNFKIIGGVILLVIWWIVAATPDPRPTTDIAATRCPVAAAAFVEQQGDRVDGEMFNAIDWGGYLAWRLPARRVFIDRRDHCYPATLLEDYRAIDRPSADWAEILQHHGVGWTMLPVDHGLNALLALDPHWREVYRDDVAVIFAPTASAMDSGG